MTHDSRQPINENVATTIADDADALRRSLATHYARRRFGRGLLLGLPLLGGALLQQAPVADAATGDWSLGGNAGTTPGTNFLGTSDARDLVLKTSNLERLAIRANGNIAIGTAGAGATGPRLQVLTGITSGLTYGVWGEAASTSGTGVLGWATASSGATQGVAGQATSSAGIGVAGTATASSGATRGVIGSAASPDGVGVYGRHTSARGVAAAVQGDSSSGTPDAVAVLGRLLAPIAGQAAAAVRGIVTSTSDEQLNAYGVWGSGSTVETVGVRGSNTEGVGVEGYSGRLGVWGHGGQTGVEGWGSWVGVEGHSDRCGVRGWSASMGVEGFANSLSGVTYGVFGESASPAGYAGYFEGRARVTGDLSVGGTLSKAAGTFLIDHPLDPQNKYLAHSFVESPEMLNVYSGTVRLDTSGAATVELPTYFAALNSDVRYQLTPIGAPAPNLHVATKLQGTRFAIAGGAAGQEVCWQVTGVRQDAYAKAHPLVVEQDKAANERGRYLHPREHGQPVEQGVEQVRHPEIARARQERQDRTVNRTRTTP